MKIGILCAGDREFAPFLPHLQNAAVSQKAMLTFYDGVIRDVPVTALFSGVCKVNAAIAAQILIARYQVDAILNVGTAGGVDPSLELFDTVISTEAAYHDVAANILTEFHPWMETVFFPADPTLLAAARRAAEKSKHRSSIRFGRMVTGEAFVSDTLHPVLIDAFHPASADMETAAIAHVCYVNQIPFLAIRCITDNAAHSGAEHFESNCLKAAAIAKDITMCLLEELRQN